MPISTVLFIALSAVAVFAIAAGSIGREARRLDAIAPRVVYNMDEAVEYVADRLPVQSQARLTPGEVESLLVVHLRWIGEHGLHPSSAEDARQDPSLDVTMTEIGLVAAILAEAEEIDVELLDDADAAHVVDAHLGYLDEIGAVGSIVPPDDIDLGGGRS